MKFYCTAQGCTWKGEQGAIDHVRDPRSAKTWKVCPRCRTPEHMARICDFQDCWKPGKVTQSGGLVEWCEEHAAR